MYYVFWWTGVVRSTQKSSLGGFMIIIQDHLNLVVESGVCRILFNDGHLLMRCLMSVTASCHFICLIVCSLSLDLLDAYISMIRIPKLNTSVLGGIIMLLQQHRRTNFCRSRHWTIVGKLCSPWIWWMIYKKIIWLVHGAEIEVYIAQWWVAHVWWSSGIGIQY